MAKQSEKISLGNAFRIHYRAFRDVHRYCPGLFASMSLHAVAAALSPYVAVFLSARIINELAGSRRPDVLWTLVLLALGSAAALTLLTGILKRWEEGMFSKFLVRENRLFTGKLLNMDFADVDKAETHDLLSQIRQSKNWQGWGNIVMVMNFTDLVQSVIGILGAF